MNQNCEFLYKSIEDIRSVIRAADVKSSYLLIILIIPISKLSSISKRTFNLLTHEDTIITIISMIITAAFFILWLLSFWLIFRTVYSITVPDNSIQPENKDGVFFPVYHFPFNLTESLGLRKSTHTVLIDEHISKLPCNTEGLIKELASEQIKLAYIASAKIKRANLAYLVSLIWLCSGATLWLLHIFLFQK